jgi:GMP synthase (glutamine-hydrolysing)
MIYYRQMCARHSDIIDVKLADLKKGLSLAGIAAVILSGSQQMISEIEPEEELQGFIRGLHIPTLGICFGHQLLARSFGAVVKKWKERVERDEKIRIRQEWELFAGLGEETVMRESHQEYVTRESVREIGWQIGAESDSCPVEAIRHPTLPLFGVQFHPERSGRNGEKLFANFFHLVSLGYKNRHITQS